MKLEQHLMLLTMCRIKAAAVTSQSMKCARDAPGGQLVGNKGQVLASALPFKRKEAKAHHQSQARETGTFLPFWE